MTDWYNQTLRNDTKYSCTVYTFLHMILLDFAVEIRVDYIIKFIYYLEKIWVLFLKSWAVFNIIYSAMVKYINFKYWILLKIETTSISKWLQNWKAYSLGCKKLTNKWQKLWTIDWVFTNSDVDLAITYKNAYAHNHCYKNWAIIDSWNAWSKLDSAIRYNISEETLKYWVEKDLYYDTARVIIPWDKFTETLKKFLIDKANLIKRPATIEEFEYILKTFK